MRIKTENIRRNPRFSVRGPFNFYLHPLDARTSTAGIFRSVSGGWQR